jgi:hypothetical protein
MWKSHLTVDDKRFIIHSPCGNRCGKLSSSVELIIFLRVFHISTGGILDHPVEMWKTLS